ncbi:tropomyosin-like [Anabas testudineus]|uniref:tropomyosin-like n=1 Tax=Anabas testudineus TaxID=64144 RepID=UPI000E4545F6|nr:tropomyosin-like [Anabas testudineus]
MEAEDIPKNKSKELNQDPAQTGSSQESQRAPNLKKAPTQAKKQNQVKALESARANHNQTHVSKKIKEKEKEIRSLQKALREQELETQRVTQYWKGEYDRVTAFWKGENDRITLTWENETKAVKAASEKNLMALNAEWEERWRVRQEELVAQIKTLQEETDKKVSQVILEKDDLITKITQEKTSLEAQCAESSAKLKEKEQELLQSQAEMNRKAEQSRLDFNRQVDLFAQQRTHLIAKGMNDRRSLCDQLNETTARLIQKEVEIIKREAKWQAQFKTLEGQVKDEVAEKTAAFLRLQELERKHREDEDEWLHKVSQVEENIELLTQRNNELQVHHLS